MDPDAIARRWGVSHILVHRGKSAAALARVASIADGAAARDLARVVDRPFDLLLDDLARNPSPPLLLAPGHGFRVLHEDAQNVLLEVPR